ncbi:MAG TPA: hypothetical protein VGH19_12395 [Verrucomicrobiae bacterium]
MTKQILLCLTNSPLHAHQVVDWLKQEGFPAKDISACVPEKRGMMTAQRQCVEMGGNASRNGHVAVLGQKFLKSAKSVVKGLGENAGIANLLMAKGFSEPEARSYEVHVKKGGIVISVHPGSLSKLRRAKEILQTAGTQNIVESGVARNGRNALQAEFA